jgi:hypothetical protein
MLKAVTEERARARASMLHRQTLATITEFQEKRRIANNACKRKKREWERKKIRRTRRIF